MKKIGSLLVLIALTSCASLFNKHIIEKTGIEEASIQLQFIDNKEKEIVFIPMRHVGRKAYYDAVAYKVDSLQKLGYTVFYEGVADDTEEDTVTIHKSHLKLRKILDYFPESHTGYLDTTTNIIAGKIKYKGPYKLMNQPSYQYLKVDTTKAKRVDATITQILNGFEQQYGEIHLDSCDMNTPLDSAYTHCKKLKRNLKKKFSQHYVKEFRNKLLAQKINDSNKHKIVVMYGAAHFTGLWYELNLLDESYTLLRTYKRTYTRDSLFK